MSSTGPLPYRLALIALLSWLSLIGLVADDDVAPPPSTAALHGQVLGDDDRPLADAVVRFLPEISNTLPGKAPLEPHVLRTGREGRFSSEAAAGERVDVRVWAKGYAFRSIRGVDPAEPLVVRLVHGFTVSGHVLEETTGRGLAGVRVRIDDEAAFALGGPELKASTDKDGRYLFPNASPGNVWVRASTPGRATRSIRGYLQAPGVLDDLWLPEGGRLAGRVLDEGGDPIAGAELFLNPLDGFVGGYRDRFVSTPVRSDRNGFFAFDGVTAGTRYRVDAGSKMHAPGSAGPFFIEPGDDLDDVTVTLQAGAALRLRVVDPEQAPVIDLTIRLDPEDDPTPDGKIRSRVLTADDEAIEIDENGILTVRRLQPGTFAIRFTPRGFLASRRESIVLIEGETTDLGTLGVKPGSRVAGKVVDTDGRPVANAEVLLRWGNLSGENSRQAKIDDDGSFACYGLPERPLALSASADGFVDRSIDRVEVGETTIEVVLTRQGAIKGTVRAADGKAPAVFSVSAVPARSSGKPSSAGTGTSGTFEVDRVDPGAYSVLIRVPDYGTARLDKVRVQGGVTADVGELVLVPGLRLEGQIVRGDDGAPCPGTAVRLDRGAGPVRWSKEAGHAMTTADGTGRFLLDGLEAGRYTLTLDHPGFAPLQRSVDLVASEATKKIELNLGFGGEIQGTVVDADGLPSRGVSVFMLRGVRGFDRRMVTTRDDGSYRFGRVAAGTYFLMRGRSSARAGFNSEVRTVDVRDGETATVDFSDQTREVGVR
jgi:hypothetical protein